MDYGVAVSTFALLFLAEMGDKTQLMAMTLAHRYRVLPVVLGSFGAFLLLNVLAVLVGEGVARLVPRNVVLITAAMLFLVFAYMSWNFVDGDDEEVVDKMGSGRAFVASFALIFVAELGDKTQLAMVAMAAESGRLWSVLLGGTAALWSVTLIAVFLGSRVLRRFPKDKVQKAAALLFLAFAVLAIGQVLIGNDAIA